MKIITTVLLVFLMTITSFQPSLANVTTGLEIMKKVDFQTRQYETKKAKVKMVITNKSNQNRERFFNLSKKYATNDKSLVKFFRPANIKGTSLLSESIDDSNTHQWIYLPAFKSIKKLSTQEKHNSFMGSDFTYSDVAGRQVGQDNHKLVKETAELYFIESIPKDKTDYYSSIRYIISKEKMAPLKIIFYHDNKKLKTLQNTQFQKLKMYMSQLIQQ